MTMQNTRRRCAADPPDPVSKASMETLLHDVAYAFTVLRRNKGFAATALLTLALGIGATTAVFSVVYGVLMRPLPSPAADRLVRLSEEHPGAVSPLRQP